MHNIALTWQQAAGVAAILFVAAALVHQSPMPRLRALGPIAREAGVIAALYSLWQLAGTLSVLGTTGAFQRADWIERTERSWPIPSEESVQGVVSGHPPIVQACNLYYATMHFGVLFAFLAWLFIRHRDRYAPIRVTLALTTLVCLLVQLVPVAPPRLLPGSGYIDTAARYGQSVYNLGLAPDELSAMPSVHVAWAVLVGWAVVRISTSRWRWIAVLHPLVTVFVVAATANHFWLDGIVATALLVLCECSRRGAVHALRAVRARRGDPIPLTAEPVGTAVG